MLQVHSAHRLDQIEWASRIAAEKSGGSILATSRVGNLLTPVAGSEPMDAVSLTVCFPNHYAALLRADVRFSAFLPSRIAVYSRGQGAVLETVGPREYCRMLQRQDLEPLAARLEDVLRTVMEEAAHSHAAASGGAHASTEDQVNMRMTLPQRIDCHGSKVEEMGGTGTHDAQGG